MIVNGIEIDLEKAAQAVATAYAVKCSDPEYVPATGDIDNLLSAYLCAYKEVISKDREALEALAR